MTDIIKLNTEVDLLGNEISDKPDIERSTLASALYAQLKDTSLEEFVSYLTNRFEAVVDYANLCAGEKTGQRISLNFNPHRLNVEAHSGAPLYDALKKESFVKGLARVVLLNKKKGNTKDLLYASIGMGVEGTVYIQEFPPHVARDLALEYHLSASSRVLDPCAGWGGRMLGFSVVVNSYECCEPSSRTAAGLRELLTFIRSFRSDFSATINEVPFEDVILRDNMFDFALTSPPYYDTEKYAPGEALNAGNRYANYEEWVEGFYAPLIHKTMAALKPGCCFVINIGSRVYPLNTSLFRLCEGKYHVEKQRGYLSASSGLGKSGEGETFYEIRKSSDAPIVLTPIDPESSTAELENDDSSVEEPITDVLSASTPERSKSLSETLKSFLDAASESDKRSETQSTAPVVKRASLSDFLAQNNTLPQTERAPVITTAGKKSASLDSFLSAIPLHADANWKAQEPPVLDGITDIVVNVETNGLNWAKNDRPIGITVATLDGQLKRFLPFGFMNGNLDEAIVKRWAHEQLKHKNITNANTRFDVHMFREWGVDLEAQHNTVSDVQHYAALLDDHRKRFALDVLATDFLGEVKIAKLDERNMQMYDAYEVAIRAEYQAELVAQLRNKMWPMLDAEDLQRVRQLEDDVIYPVCEMEKNGEQIDVELLDQFSAECTREEQRLLKEISDEVGFSFDLSTGAWIRLFEACRIPITELASGKPSFAEKVVGQIEHPLVKKAHLADQYSTLNSKTFAAYKKIIDDKGVLRFDINQLRGDDGGTVSGRFSIGYVQQVPNAANHFAVFGDHLFPRKLFVAASGEVLAADAAQIEYRLLAHYANNKAIIEEYRKDPTISFHKTTWEMMKKHKPDMLYPHQKSFNFAKQYGAKSIRLASMMGFITTEEGDEIRQKKAWSDPRLALIQSIESAYKRMMPEGDALLDKAAKTAEERGYVKTLLGRRARWKKYPVTKFGNTTMQYTKTYVALNRIIQGTAADIMKMKLVALHKARTYTNFLMRLTVHDEVKGDAQTPETAQRVSEVLAEQPFSDLKVPILWETNTGHSWADCK